MDGIGNRTVRDLVLERERRHPDKVALVHENKVGSIAEFTYRELRESTERVAQGFLDLGIRRGERVVIQLGNTPEFVFCWLGLAWMGAVAVPANTGNTFSETRHVAALSDARAFVSTPAIVREYRARALELGSIEFWLPVSGEANEPSVSRWLSRGCDGIELPVEAEDVAELVFTSGTSALPKAVMLTHANYLHSGERESRTTMVDGTDRLLTALPLFHVNAQSNTVLAALTVGATAIVLEEYRATKFWQQVRTHKATQLSLVAMQLRTILAQPPTDDDADHVVRRNIYAINVSTPEKEAFEARFGMELVNGYGLSEAMTVVTAAPLHGEKRWPSIGLPAYGREVRVVSPDGSDTAVGEPGEIVVGGIPGRSLMKGYFKDPQATAAALRDGWLHTGDNGYFDDKGYLYFLDRSKDVIKRAGENVSSSEVEMVLSAHPAVLEVAVIGVPDPIRDEAVKAYIVLRDGQSVDAQTLQSFCRESLARFKVPTLIEFRTTLPKTSVGKIQKKLLREERGGGDE